MPLSAGSSGIHVELQGKLSKSQLQPGVTGKDYSL
jgi:hypothetical protein